MGIVYKEEIYHENTEEEDFFFYILCDLNVYFYIFYDDWGMGIGLHKKQKKESSLWYFENLGITNEENQYKFMVRIMKDIVAGKKIFSVISEDNIEIDFSDYNEISYSLDCQIKEKISIYDVDKIYEKYKNIKRI